MDAAYNNFLQQPAQRLRNAVAYVACRNCAQPILQTTKFCGSCGVATGIPQATTASIFRAVEEPNESSAHLVPSFAHVQHHTVPKELQEELGSLLFLLARERVFLLMHCSLFLAINLVGLWVSLKAYYGYDCDEITRGVIALTPIFYINSCSLPCLAPIKGTRIEIERLKERITFTRHRIEYYGFF